MSTPLDAMQAAVDIVLTSPHPTNKIAASLFTSDFTISRTNVWPEKIMQVFGMDGRIGNSSGTIHAEVGCILAFPHPTEGASLCVTDPFCPNCAKNMAEAGIKHIYIDHKGFDKDFAQRRGDEYQSMSLRIAQRAGISVYEVRRKENVIIPLLETPENYTPPEDNPIKIEAVNSVNLLALVASVKVIVDRWACGYAEDDQGQIYSMVASAHAAIGYSETSVNDFAELGMDTGKYNFFLEPMTRLMMNAARYGLKLIDGEIYSSFIPTSREQVNMVAAGLTTLRVGNIAKARDDEALHARSKLEGAGILAFKPLY